VYVEQPNRLTHDRLAILRALTLHLDCAPGPGGSRSTDPVSTKNIFGPALADLRPAWWTQAMVLALYPSSQIVRHCDPPITGIRFHLPLVVNADCWVCHADVWQQLEAGAVYTMDPTQPHGAVNWGATPRFHLVLDIQETP
jgi:hypothetical protein